MKLNEKCHVVSEEKGILCPLSLSSATNRVRGSTATYFQSSLLAFLFFLPMQPQFIFYHLIKSPVMGCMSCHVTLDVMFPFFNRK